MLIVNNQSVRPMCWRLSLESMLLELFLKYDNQGFVIPRLRLNSYVVSTEMQQSPYG